MSVELSKARRAHDAVLDAIVSDFERLQAERQNIAYKLEDTEMKWMISDRKCKALEIRVRKLSEQLASCTKNFPACQFTPDFF